MDDGGSLEEGGVRATAEDALLLQPLVGAADSSTVIGTLRAPPQTRLASLDVFRGLAIAVMILVDNAGGLWPSINHSPWNGVTLADFVMPFFLFIVGVALALTYKRIANKKVATQKAVVRAFKLLVWGIVLQGGYYHGLNNLSYGVDLDRIRWCGVLQRIALAYLVVALCEIWAPRGPDTTTTAPSVTLKVFKIYYFHWAVAAAVTVLYLALLYGVYVPDWDFSAPAATNTTLLHVKCGTRGDIGPACNAVGYLDRTLLGLSHLHPRPVYQRTPECSVNSPDYGPLPIGAPDWCKAPFDPEGLLSSVSAIGSCFLGLHFGHILVHRKDHTARLWDWTVPSIALLVVGLLLHLLGMPFNKPLYSFSYVCFTGGAAGLVFAALYLLVDVCGWRCPTLLLEWLGQNALLMYALVACGVLPAALQGFYWKSPENNVVDLAQAAFELMLQSRKWAKLVDVLCEVFAWCLVAGVLRYKGIFWKI